MMIGHTTVVCAPVASLRYAELRDLAIREIRTPQNSFSSLWSQSVKYCLRKKFNIYGIIMDVLI